MVNRACLGILACICCLYTSPALASWGFDGSYAKSGSDELVTLAGNGTVGEHIVLNGKLSKSSSKRTRYDYGVIAKDRYKLIVFEAKGRVLDMHKTIGGSAGLGPKEVYVTVGGAVEYVNDGEDVSLFVVGLKSKYDYGHLSFNSKISWLTDQHTKQRLDHEYESRFSWVHIYVGARYSYIREVTRQAAFVGVKF